MHSPSSRKILIPVLPERPLFLFCDFPSAMDELSLGLLDLGLEANEVARVYTDSFPSPSSSSSSNNKEKGILEAVVDIECERESGVLVGRICCRCSLRARMAARTASPGFVWSAGTSKARAGLRAGSGGGGGESIDTVTSSSAAGAGDELE